MIKNLKKIEDLLTTITSSEKEKLKGGFLVIQNQYNIARPFISDNTDRCDNIRKCGDSNNSGTTCNNAQSCFY
jgi:hypothetical protein